MAVEGSPRSLLIGVALALLGILPAITIPAAREGAQGIGLMVIAFVGGFLIVCHMVAGISHNEERPEVPN